MLRLAEIKISSFFMEKRELTGSLAKAPIKKGGELRLFCYHWEGFLSEAARSKDLKPELSFATPVINAIEIVLKFLERAIIYVVS